MARFRYMDASGREVPVESVPALAAAVHRGEVIASTLLFDEVRGRWAPAKEHDAAMSALAAMDISALPSATRATSPAPASSAAPRDQHAQPRATLVPFRLAASAVGLALLAVLLLWDAVLGAALGVSFADPTNLWLGSMTAHLAPAFGGAAWRLKSLRSSGWARTRALLSAALLASGGLVVVRAVAAFRQRAVLDPSLDGVITVVVLNCTAALIAAVAVVAGELAWPSKGGK